MGALYVSKAVQMTPNRAMRLKLQPKTINRHLDFAQVTTVGKINFVLTKLVLFWKWLHLKGFKVFTLKQVQVTQLKIDKKSEVTLRVNYINSNVAGLYPLTLTKNFRIFFCSYHCFENCCKFKGKKYTESFGHHPAMLLQQTWEFP